MNAKICDVCGNVYAEDDDLHYVRLCGKDDHLCVNKSKFYEICTECMNKVIDILEPCKVREEN